MGNTDLHNQNVKNHMTREQFITNLKGANEVAKEEQRIIDSLDGEIPENQETLPMDTLEVGETRSNCSFHSSTGMQGLEDLDEQMLSEIYDRIERKVLKTGQDASSQVKQIEDSLVNKLKLPDNQPLAVPG